MTVASSYTIRLGPFALVAHITGGHTRGCSSWSFSVRDGERLLNVVSACDLGILELTQYPEQAADLERSFRVLRSLPAANPADPFIDPGGYRAYIDTAEKEFRSSRRHSRQRASPHHSTAADREHQ